MYYIIFYTLFLSLFSGCALHDNSFASTVPVVENISLTRGIFSGEKKVTQKDGLKITEEYIYEINLDENIISIGTQTRYSGIVSTSSSDIHLHNRRFNNEIVKSTISNGAIILSGSDSNYPIVGEDNTLVTGDLLHNKQQLSFHLVQEIYTQSKLITTHGYESRIVNNYVSDQIDPIYLNITTNHLEILLFKEKYYISRPYYKLVNNLILKRDISKV